MLSSGLLPILLVLSVLELSWSLSDEDKKIILDEHNKYRSQVSPPAKAMMKMSWDMDLEADAQDHAKKCFWGQNGGPGRENLFATTSALDIKLAIEQWNGEKKFFNFTTFECNHEQMCDNYTQVVWAETTHIGCGSNFCKKIDGFGTGNMQLFVCSYYPPGNTEDKTPFKEGSSCTVCPTGTVCENNLCASALHTEELETNLDQTSVDPPKAAAPSTCLGLSLFLLPSATLVGLLL